MSLLGKIFSMYQSEDLPSLKKHNFIVYQFGKVASTSIVNSLNKLPDTASFQSHFLGCNNFQNAIKRLDDPVLDDYFYHHLEGQLFRNLRLNREVIKFKSGCYPGQKLHFVSVARDPVDYARSALLQDINGYLNSFVVIWGRGDESEPQYIQSSVDKLIALYQGFLEQTDLSLVKDMSPIPGYIDRCGYIGERKTLLVQMMQVMHRPLIWFDSQFRNYLGIRVEDMSSEIDGMLYKDLGWCDSYLFKYENLGAGMKGMLTKIGMGDGFSFSRDNDSALKPYVRELNCCFSDDVKEEILTLQRASSYCQLFGY